MATHLNEGRHVALTFDDGPHPEGTPATLDMLAELDLRATFFLTGEQVLRFPELASEIAARGHTLGVHGFRHVLLTLRPPGSTRKDLARAVDAVAAAAHYEPTHYRPPYGVANPPALRVARRLGLRTILWSRWGRDWEARATPKSVAAHATRDLRGGEIILLHDADHYSYPDSWRVSVEALPLIAATVTRMGLEFAPTLDVP